MFNAIDGRYLGAEWPHDYADVEFRYGMRDIRAPTNLGNKGLAPFIPVPDR